ncbi:MAG TPA: hypothetical protein VH561_08815 [Micromonosporaceae bacterium]|jgi:hypothetical protein
MTGRQPRRRPPITEAHARLGAALRTVRKTAGLTTRQIPKAPDGCYSSGHISLVEAGAVAASPELVEAYLVFSTTPGELRSLYQQALAATREAGRRRRQGHLAARAGPPRDPGSITDRQQVQEHYIVVAQEADYRFHPTGSIRDVLLTSWIRATSPGVRLVYGGFSYLTDPRRGVLSVEPVAGGRLAEMQESETGAIKAYLETDRDINPDDSQPYRISYRLKVDSPQRSVPRLRYFADEGTKQLRVRAEFPASVDPGVLWWFAAPGAIDAEYRDPRRKLRPGTGGVYHRTFDDLVPGWCYGLTWSW